MRLGTTTDCFDRLYGEGKALEKLAQIGYDCVDYSLFIHSQLDGLFSKDSEAVYAYYAGIKKTADNAGISIYQTHAPMLKTLKDDNTFDEKVMHITKNSIVATAALGGEYIVIHPVIPTQRKNKDYIKETEEINVRFYGELTPVLEKYGIKMGVENMFGWDPKAKRLCETTCSTAEEMAKYVDMLGDSYVACLDIGHMNLLGFDPAEAIRTLGSRLQLLHVHDNDAIDDRHVCPYMGNIKWDEVCAALKETGYTGAFSFEAQTTLNMYPQELWYDAEALMYKTGRYMIEKYGL